MGRRIRSESLIAALLLIANTAVAAVNVRYDFDSPDLAAGPDTFQIFEHAKGRVDLASDIRYSGYHSLLISDAAGDGDFPELQGYYDVVDRGVLRFRFAMLVATPHEQLNVALAGPQHFQVAKDGIAFWLKTRDGWLLHVSDGIPKKLFLVQPFVWYLIDVRYDVDAGRYDLLITQEGVAAPVTDLKKQPNAANAAASAVSMFSFVGEVFGDDSNVRYYVDDIALGDGGAPARFAAPGRRKLFIDRWLELAKSNAARKSCPPVLGFDDVGADSPNAARERIAWLSDACAAIERGDAAKVIEQLEGPGRAFVAYQLAAIVVLTRLQRWEDAERRWSELAPLLRNDIRYGYIAALIGMHRRNWDDAELWLREPAERVGRDELERKLIAEEYYFVLLWRKEYAAAARYAQRVVARLSSLGISSSWWRERNGDAEFLAGNRQAARRAYESALSGDNAWSVTEKLADIAYLDGDHATERKLREKLYGRL